MLALPLKTGAAAAPRQVAQKTFFGDGVEKSARAPSGAETHPGPAETRPRAKEASSRARSAESFGEDAKGKSSRTRFADAEEPMHLDSDDDAPLGSLASTAPPPKKRGRAPSAPPDRQPRQLAPGLGGSRVPGAALRRSQEPEEMPDRPARQAEAPDSEPAVGGSDLLRRLLSRNDDFTPRGRSADPAGPDRGPDRGGGLTSRRAPAGDSLDRRPFGGGLLETLLSDQADPDSSHGRPATGNNFGSGSLLQRTRMTGRLGNAAGSHRLQSDVVDLREPLRIAPSEPPAASEPLRRARSEPPAASEPSTKRRRTKRVITDDDDDSDYVL